MQNDRAKLTLLQCIDHPNVGHRVLSRTPFVLRDATVFSAAAGLGEGSKVRAARNGDRCQNTSADKALPRFFWEFLSTAKGRASR